MKVKCKSIFNEHTKQYENVSHWLTMGKEYTVLSILVYDNRILYGLIDDGSNLFPGAHEAFQFEVVSHKIPTNWKINPGTLALFTLGPQAWEEDEFWDLCHDGDAHAIEVYKREATFILNQEDNGSYSFG